MNKIRDLILVVFAVAMLTAFIPKVEGVNASIRQMGSIPDTSIGNMTISHQQSKAQVYFFQQALDEFGAKGLEQVIELWAKGDQTRNGVYKYAVACKSLKEEIIKKWGKAEEGFWIIGGSSPWVRKYEVVNKRKISDNSYEVKIKYYWETSAGESPPTEETLFISKGKDFWCVNEVK